MQVRFRSLVVLVLVAAASLAIHADGSPRRRPTSSFSSARCSIPKAGTSNLSRRFRTP